MEEDSHTITNKKMRAFTRKFEEFALDDERLLVEKITELLASSRYRKEKMIQAAADDIIDSARKQHCNINQEISEMEIFATDAEEKWTNYIQKTEAKYVEDSVVLESGKSSLGNSLQCCMTKSTEVAEQHLIAEESLLDVLERNTDSIDAVIKNVTEDNEIINTRFSSTASSILEETNGAEKNATASIESLVKLDHEASEKIHCLNSFLLESVREMKNIHSEKVVQISTNARKSLIDDYLVDDSSDLSPRKRDLNFPSKESIESLMNICVGNSLESPRPPEIVSNSIDKCPNSPYL